MNTFRAFIVGFLTLLSMHVLVTCSEEDSSTQPTVVPNVNVEKIHEAAQRIEDAFRSGDPAAVFEELTEEAQQQYDEQLIDIVSEMPAFADAIVSRQLVGYSDYYAEYSYAHDGRTLTFALAAQDENEWKLIRF